MQKTIKSILSRVWCIILVSEIHLCSASEPNWLSKVTVEIKGKPVALAELDINARMYAQHKMTTIPNNAEPTFEVRQKGKIFILMHYQTEVGKRFWRIGYSRKGEVNFYYTSVLKGD